MDNLTLRIMRSLDDSFDGPEYANHLLVAEIPTDTRFDHAQELSIRVYSELYQLLGTDVWQKPDERKIPRKIRFRLSSSRYWDEMVCHLFLYCNGRPRWYASCSLLCDYDRWEKVELEEIADHPDERFFVDRLCYQSWWFRLEQGRFAPSTIRDLIHKLRLRATASPQWPHLFVTGDERQADTFATSILAAYLSDRTPSVCCRFALDDLLSGLINWPIMKENLACMKVVVFQVDPISLDDQSENILALFVDWLKSPAAPPFIFHGSEQSFDQLRQYIPDIVEMFEANATFVIPPLADPTWGILDDPYIPLPAEADFYDFRFPKEPKEKPNGSSDALQKLEKLVGLSRLKTDMRDACLMARFAQERRKLGLNPGEEERHHMIFYGNPGTGKTTVARLVGEIFHQMGLLSKGHTVETCRTDLVGEFIGHTESRMKEVLEQARGGVLFIDEAYTLVSHDRNSNDFGKEVIHALLTILSEPNPDMIIILAGYKEKMQALLKTNPGLNDRFPLKFYFEDYSADELYEIALHTLQERNFVLTPEADLRLREIIVRANAYRDENFGNGRWVHNLVEQGIVKSMACRIMSMPCHDCTDRTLLCTIEAADINEAEGRISVDSVPTPSQPIRIGFRA